MAQYIVLQAKLIDYTPDDRPGQRYHYTKLTVLDADPSFEQDTIGLNLNVLKAPPEVYTSLAGKLPAFVEAEVGFTGAVGKAVPSIKSIKELQAGTGFVRVPFDRAGSVVVVKPAAGDAAVGGRVAT